MILKLDRIDLGILAALQRNGRMSKLKLAEAVNMSPAACWERLRRLEQAGVIQGYTVLLNRQQFKRLTTVLVQVTLKSHRQSDFQRFEAAMLEEPAVVQCDATGGGIDYILRIHSPDIDAYQRLIDKFLAADIGIDRYFSYVVTKPVKSTEISVLDLQPEV